MTIPRDSVPADRTWDADSVFPTVAAWEAELEAVLADLLGLAAFSGRLGESAQVLVEALQARDAIVRRSGRVVVYALLGYAVETTDPAAVARFGRAQAADAQVRAAVAFVEPEVLDARRGAAPRLGGGRSGAGGVRPLPRRSRPAGRAHPLRRGRGGARARRPTSSPGRYGVYSALTDSDVVFAPAVSAEGAQVDVTQGSIDMLLASPDRALRKSAWESYADGYLGVRNALAANLSGTIKQAVFQARVRRYESPLAASLSRSNVPVEVFDNLIATFEANLPTWHRYWAVAAADRTASTGSHRTTSRRRSGLPHRSSSTSSASSGSARRSSRSGTTYVDTVRRGCLEERWVDVYPTAGKMGGAFSAGAPGTAPFIVMSFDGRP